MRRKSPFRRMMAVVLVIVFAFVGFNFGKMFFGDNAESRITEVTKIILAVSVYLTVLICLIPFCFTDVIWNWSAQTSYVYIYGGVDTVYHPSVILVAAGCFTAVFTALMIVCVLMLFFWWVFESPVGGYIVMLLYAAEEMYRGLVFNGRVTMNAVVISEKHIRVFSNFIYPVLVLAGLLMITYILFCKKDLLKKDIYN